MNKCRSFSSGMDKLETTLWPNKYYRPNTILEGHQLIARAPDRVLKRILRNASDLEAAPEYLEWLERFQQNMHSALLAFFRDHPGAPIPLVKILYPFEENEVTKYPTTDIERLPLLAAFVTTALLTRMRIYKDDTNDYNLAGGDRRALSTSQLATFHGIFTPSQGVSGLASLQKALQGVDSFNHSFDSACVHFEWYHSFYGWLFRKDPQNGLSRSPAL
jgi:hypothetical protein